MSAHDCKTFDPSCSRCDLSRDEAEMTQQTPTEEEVREVYVGDGRSPAAAELDVEFDRFLASVREVAIAELAAAHRAIAEEARADGDGGRAHLHDWAADRAEIYAKEHTP